MQSVGSVSLAELPNRVPATKVHNLEATSGGAWQTPNVKIWKRPRHALGSETPLATCLLFSSAASHCRPRSLPSASSQRAQGRRSRRFAVSQLLLKGVCVHLWYSSKYICLDLFSINKIVLIQAIMIYSETFAIHDRALYTICGQI